MNDSEVREKLYRLLKKHSKSTGEIKPDSDILADTGLDSVSVMDIVLELEDELDIIIPVESLSDVRTIDDFEKVVLGVLNNDTQV